jgi:hypothetical protein
MSFKTLFAGAAAAALVSTVMATPAAAVVITNGSYSVGVSEFGLVYDQATNTGFQRGDGYDFMGSAVRDSWGVTGLSGSQFAETSENGGNSAGVGLVSFNSTASSATSVTTTEDLRITQNFSFVAGNVLAIETTLFNLTGADLSGVFQRVADFDVDMNPTAEDGYVESDMYFGKPFDSTSFGFDTNDASQPWWFGCCGYTGDLGAGMRVNFTNIAANGSFKFTYYYAFGNEGAWGVRESLQGAGAQGGVVIEDADGMAAGGMGLSVPGVVPEPSTWALMIGGFGLAGATLRRRRLAHA